MNRFREFIKNKLNDKSENNLTSHHQYLGTPDHNYKDYSDGAETLNNVKHDLHPKHNLSNDESGSLLHYAKDNLHHHWPLSGYRMINKFHRGDLPERYHDYGKEIQETSNHIDSAIAKHKTNHDLHVWRGLGQDPYHGNGDTVQKQVSSLNPGDTFHDKGYVSTTAFPSAARAFGGTVGSNEDHLLHIHVPKGSNAVSLNTYGLGHAHEHEVLLPRNSKFRYDGKEEHEEHSGFRKVIIHHLTHLGTHEE
jgi:hypothetical protein